MGRRPGAAIVDGRFDDALVGHRPRVPVRAIAGSQRRLLEPPIGALTALEK